MIKAVKIAARLFIFSFILIHITSCSSESNQAASDDNSANLSLSVSGQPITIIRADEPYLFTPFVTNPENGLLTFTATNLPDWLALDSVNGQISGIPDSSDIAVYSDILLTVRDDAKSVSLAPFNIEVLASGVSLPVYDFDRPAGIYLLTIRRSVSEIRDYPFVDGVNLRTSWGRTETAEDVYDFSLIDEFVMALDAIDQKLSLTIFSQKIPQYLLDDPAVVRYESYNQNGNGDTFDTAVPWDTTTLDRYELFLRALGDHMVMSLETGTPVPFRDHPVLSVLGAQIVGLGGLRDPLGAVASIDGYTRELFTVGTARSMQTVIDEFPDIFVHVAIFGIDDEISSPPLDDHIVSNFNEQFNSDAQPRLGYFAENLACDTPGLFDRVATQQDTTFIDFQMLQAWQDPFQNEGRTAICATENNGPDIAIEYALTHFNSRYFELYPVDLDHVLYWPVLQEWHDFLEKTLE